MVRVGERLFLIKTTQIDWVEAAGNYARVHAGKESSLVRQSLGRLEAVLDPGQFLRVNRSAIVNLDQIRELVPHFHGEYRLFLRNGAELTLTRSHRHKFHRLVGAGRETP